MNLEEIKLEQNKVKDVKYLEDSRESMLNGFKNGYELGKTTHFKDIDNHFRWLRQNVIIFGGYGNHGKSTMLNQMILLRALKDGEKFAIFSPENMPVDFFYNDLIHTLIGKSTIMQHHNRMTQIEYEAGMDFIKDHFFLIYPEYDEPTPKYINERFKEAIEKHGVDGCITDPFNQLIRDWEKSQRDDRYIIDYLQKEKSFAQKNNIYKITVAHCKSPSNAFKDTDFLKDPTVFNLLGGSAWNSAADDIVFIHRPYKHTDHENTMANFISDKIKKQRLCGRPGIVEMTFNIMENRYYIGGENPFYELDAFIREKIGL